MGNIGGTFGATAPEADTLGEALGMMFGNGIFGIGNGVWLIVGLVVSLAIMAMGVGDGIEKANKIMMPLLFGLFVILAVYVCTLPGAAARLQVHFHPQARGPAEPPGLGLCLRTGFLLPVCGGQRLRDLRLLPAQE